MTSTSGKRIRKPSAKEQARVSSRDQQPKKSMWCLVEIEKVDGSKKEELVCSKYLELETGEPVSQKDLYCGSIVILIHNNQPYEATILETFRSKPAAAMPSRKKKIYVDSSDDEVLSLPKKKSKQEVLKHNIQSLNNSMASAYVTDLAEKTDTMTDETDIPAIHHEEEVLSDSSDYHPPKQPGHGLSPPTILTTSLSKTKPSKDSMTPKRPRPQPLPTTSSSVTSFSVRFSLPLGAKSQKEYLFQDQLNRIEKKLDDILKACSSKTIKKYQASESEDACMSKYITENGIDLMSIKAEDPFKYALHLMDVFFTDQEMAESCYVSSKRTKKPGLNSDKVAFLEECVKKRLQMSNKEFEQVAGQLRRKCMQKCIDKGRAMKSCVPKNELMNED